MWLQLLNTIWGFIKPGSVAKVVGFMIESRVTYLIKKSLLKSLSWATQYHPKCVSQPWIPAMCLKYAPTLVSICQALWIPSL